MQKVTKSENSQGATVINKLILLILLFSTLLFTACNAPTEPPVTLLLPTIEPVVDGAAPTIIPPTDEPIPPVEPTSFVPTSTAEPVPPTTTIEPTSTAVPTMMPTPEPSILDGDPQDWEALMQWLLAARNSGMTEVEARMRLDAAGWMQDLSIFPGTEIAQDFRSADLSGDGRPEWIVAVKVKDSAQISSPRGLAYNGNAYIVADDAVVPYFADPDSEITFGQTLAPSFLIGSIGDFTEDGIEDVIIENLTCGANRCYGMYRLMSYHHGFLQDVSDDRFSTAMTFPHLTVAPCEMGCRVRAEVSVWVGPNFGGARHTDIWAWNGSQFAFGGTVLDVPQEIEAVAPWVQTYWATDVPFDTMLTPALLNAGWISGEADVDSADFDGDGTPDWVLHIADPNSGATAFGRSGDLWLMSAQGLFQFVPTLTEFDPSFQTLRFETLPDITGDTLPELLAIVSTCGAHTCFEQYRVFSFHHGVLENIVNGSEPDNSFGSSYSELAVIGLGGDASLQLRGGAIGSVGAGIVRTDTQIWAWDGTRISHLETILDATNWQHHLLYEANALTSSGNAARIESGIALYERIITDNTLDVQETFDAPDTVTSYDGARQFAAFRLVYTWLRADDIAAAQTWLDFLEATYPDGGLTLVGRVMFNDYATSGDIVNSCTVAQATIGDSESPFGAISYQGYGNLELTLSDLCN